MKRIPVKIQKDLACLKRTHSIGTNGIKENEGYNWLMQVYPENGHKNGVYSLPSDSALMAAAAKYRKYSIVEFNVPLDTV